LIVFQIFYGIPIDQTGLWQEVGKNVPTDDRWWGAFPKK
jgi:hypothetical protein